MPLRVDLFLPVLEETIERLVAGVKPGRHGIGEYGLRALNLRAMVVESCARDDSS